MQDDFDELAQLAATPSPLSVPGSARAPTGAAAVSAEGGGQHRKEHKREYMRLRRKEQRDEEQVWVDKVCIPC